MKRFLLPLLLLLLTACSPQSLSGQVTEVITGPDGTLTALVIETDAHEERGLLITGETMLFSHLDGVSQDLLLAYELPELIVSAECERLNKTLVDGREMPACTVPWVSIDQVHLEDTLLADGTPVELWLTPFSTSYRLPNGPELLSVRRSSGPENVLVGGAEGYADLPEAAQQRVSAYYQEQGLLYDTQAELERAYRAYVDTGCPEDFDSHMLEQSIYPTASSQEVMYFLTSVTLPLDGNTATELRLGAAFDRKTGEALEPQELFTCSPEALITALLNCSKVTEPTLRREMTTAFRPEYLVFFPEHLEVSFPQGVLPSQEHAYILSIPYEDLPLSPWAIPEAAA
ncbi:hypothetical protein NE612_13355 [Oscillibacter valericigenes]|nr:hypothetical protein [Oscillibacter sp.]MCQ5027826.1 hypothetical protein [Oscillibacter valericigenes]